MLTDRERLIALNLAPGIGSASLRRLLEAFGGLDRIFAAGVREIQQAAGLRAPAAERLAAACRDERRLARELELAKRAGVAILTPADAGYPDALRTIPDPPLALYVRGLPAEVESAPAVAIVGSRHASLYGLECAERLACELSLRGVTIVSGLARGIDGAAHRGALKAGGRTVAVLGSGLSRVYPTEHERLADEVAGSGWLVSEYPMETEPLPRNFPQRNRLISGWSLGVVVVEAAARSGALITADCALEQGREVFAVPGPMAAVTSQGTHHLLKQGARLVTSVEDILEELRLVPLAAGGGGGPIGSTAVSTELAEAEARVLACVKADPHTIDAVALKSGLGMPEVSSLLLQLEVKHLVRQLPGKRFVKAVRSSELGVRSN